MAAFNKLISLLSWIPLIELPALGWRLQGWWGFGIGLVIGALIWNWAHDWEVREVLKRQREEKAVQLG